MMPTSPLFWFIALALVAATLALLVMPLLRRAAAADARADDESAVTAVFRDHKRQIEADFAAGTITREERETALSELTQRFGQELAQTGSDGGIRPGEHSRWLAALVLVACLPVISGVLYFTLGNPAAMSSTAAAARDPHAGDPQVAAMIEQLASRLKANPDDGEGWAMLGRSYRVTGRADLSAQAYAEAAKRLPPNAAIYTDWAEAIALGQGRSLAGRPTELLDRALAIDPDNAKALALAGAAAAERNDIATAARHWTRLKGVLPPDSPLIAEVDRRLASVGSAAAPAPSPAPPPPAASAAASGPTVAGRVALDPKLAKSVAPGDIVFILARDPDGSRMPLAVMRIAASELPRAFVLTDAMAMSPAATISKAAKVVVEARVSKTGDAKAQPGDLSGMSKEVAPGARDVTVTIDRVLP